MDVTGIFNAGGVLVKNPNYSKSKKNTQPEYITVTDFSQLPSGSTTGTALTDVAYQGAEKNGVILGDYDDWKKYINHGITPNSIEQNLDIQLANNQSFLENYDNLCDDCKQNENQNQKLKTAIATLEQNINNALTEKSYLKNLIDKMNS